TILRTLRRATAAPDPASRMRELRAVPTFGIWRGLLRVVGAFGDCPRCLAVCPVGEDYNRFLREDQRVIPEKTEAKVALARQLLQIRRKGDPIPGLAAGRDRWIGEAGYVPPGRAGAPRGASPPRASRQGRASSARIWSASRPASARIATRP